MHELAIASAVLEAVRQEAEKRSGARVTKVGLRLGELAGLDPDALSFSFEVLVKDSEFDRLVLEIQNCPVQYRCRRCDETFLVQDYVTTCPRCGLPDTECVSGAELELAYLEVEE